jgi:nitronate monooxygenase
MADDSDRVIPATPRRRDAARKQGAMPTAAVLAGVAMAATALVLLPGWLTLTVPAAIDFFRRSLVAAMALGAEGMNMGTRFMATKDAPIHQNVKDALVKASELDTRLVMRPLRNTERVLNNAGVTKILEKEKQLGAGIKFEDIIEEVAGVYPRIMKEGDMDAGAWSCGMVAGLIHDIPTVKELIDRIMREADEIITKRLTAAVRG